MNITDLAKKWLIEHEHYEHEPQFKNDLSSLCQLIESVIKRIDDGGYVGYGTKYDPNFGDDKKCECSHIYYRHFDSYDEMSPIGCKYCICSNFEEKK